MKTLGLCHPSFFILDHLAPLSYYFDIPLVCFDPKILEMAQKYYPSLNIRYEESMEKSVLSYLQEYDLILHSMLSWSTLAISLREILGRPECRIAYMPHGNSDKKRVMQDPHLKHDIFLVYGNHMLEMLSEKIKKGDIHTAIPIGNLRARYYVDHKDFFDQIAHQEIPITLGKKTVLYAPTWEDGENRFCFFEEAEKLCTALSQTFNLLIKPHPHIEEKYPVEYFLLKSRCEEKGVQFVEDFPHIYSLLSKVDLFIGDTSSMAYDFLFYDRPIYLVASAGKTLLEGCSFKLPSDEGQILPFIIETLERNQKELSLERNQLFSYSFATEEMSQRL